MHLIDPTVLWLLVAIPPLAGLALWFAWTRNERFQNDFGDRKLTGRLSEFVTSGTYLAKGFCLIVGLSLLVVALSRPSIKNGTAEFPHGTIDVISIVDVSRSMAVPDYKEALVGTSYAEGRRLDMARHLILTDVVPSLNYNRLGIISYAGTGFPMAFLSDDMLALDWMLKRALVMGSAPGENSEVGKAFNMAFTLFDLDSKPGNRKVIVLFSDGGNDTELPELHAAIKELEKRGIELIIVGLGKPIGSPIPVKLLSKSDQSRYSDKKFYEHEGQVVTSKLEENTLLLMRNMTGGRYVRVVNPSDFSIGSLISKADVKRKEGEQELFMWPLMFSALFLFATLFIPRTLKGSNELPQYRFTRDKSSKKPGHGKRDRAN
ncbi:MAG: VWA domain-containing protein [Candidatus Melainabacteria bacterium]|nr:VWA domain-containing protein [Candidatus Melainabacteria bacterium]